MSDLVASRAVLRVSTPDFELSPVLSDGLFRSAFEHALEAIVIADERGMVLEANSRACRLFDRSIEEMRGCPLAQVIDLNDSCVHDAFLRANDHGQFSGVLPLRKRDGSCFPANVSATRFNDSDGRVRICAFVRDASGVGLAERSPFSDGEHRVSAKVQHAQKLESLGVLAGGIAHDFNNLLVGILGNASLALMDMPDDSPLREIVEDIETTALRAADLTKQMLAYSGKGRFVVQQLDLNTLVREMAQLLETVINKRVVLRFAVAGDLPSIDADATQLRQIVMNLITNASDAIGNEDGVITVRTGTREATRDYLRSSHVDDELPEGVYAFIEVEDSGCGMDSVTIERIFDPFFSTKFTGRGLGLAAALGIVRGHRGTIKVASTPGQGTIFTVLLPCPPADSATAVTAPAPPGDRFRGRGAVLVVDDDETVRTVAQHMLERSGFTVLTAVDGAEGVSVFREASDRIRLVLLDLTMPSMTGEEAFRAMRQLRPDVRVVLMSGYSRLELAARFGAEGLAGFIQKPFRVEELEACLTAVVSAGLT